MGKRNLNWREAHAFEARLRKAWTIKGVYLNPKRQQKLKCLSPELVEQNKPVFFGRRQDFCFWLRHKLIDVHTTTGHQKHAFAFTDKGKEIFNIWRGRMVLIGDDPRAIINGEPWVVKPYYTTIK